MRNVTGAVWTSIRVSFPGPQEGSGAAEALKRSGETAGRFQEDGPSTLGREQPPRPEQQQLWLKILSN